VRPLTHGPDDPEKRIAELENQLANEINVVNSPNQHRETTDEPTEPSFNAAATTADEPRGRGKNATPGARQERVPVDGNPYPIREPSRGVLQLVFGVFGAGRFYIGSKAIGGCQLGLTPTVSGANCADVCHGSHSPSHPHVYYDEPHRGRNNDERLPQPMAGKPPAESPPRR